MALGPANILYDGNGNPIAVTPGATLATTQSAIACAGSDYASTPAVRVPKIDSSGQQYVVHTTTAGTSTGIAVNTVTSTPANFAGVPALGWDPVNTRFTPLSLDPNGSTTVNRVFLTTVAYSPATQINTTANSGKSMISVLNGSTTVYQRVTSCEFMCPPQAGLSNGLLSSSTYTTVGMGCYKMTGHSAGTVLPGALHDTRGTIDSNLTCRTGATITGQASAPLYCFDAANSATQPYGHREDDYAQLWTLAPGEGITFQCLSSVGTTGVNFYVRLVCMASAT